VKSNNKKIVKYGKSSQDLISLKKVFFKNNNELLSNGRKINEFYSQQPKRLKCKNCDNDLHDISFSKLCVDYTICETCGHLNGMNEDTDLFCSHIYTDNKGVDYSELYNSKGVEEYNKRVEDIYAPKVKFMSDALLELGLDPVELRYADFGAGSGYFVSAMKNAELNNVEGYEVSEQQVVYGNKLIGKDLLQQINLKDTVDKIKTLEVDMVSMIGVLEHVRNPREILSAISTNQKIKYFYISVPLFSASVFFEMVFPDVMNRQLSGAHTHLYTESSLEYMANEFNFNTVASWWFGTDIVDLHRSVSVLLEKNKNTKNMASVWTELFTPIVDSLQLCLDKKHMSSEVHMIFRVN